MLRTHFILVDLSGSRPSVRYLCVSSREAGGNYLAVTNAPGLRELIAEVRGQQALRSITARRSARQPACQSYRSRGGTTDLPELRRLPAFLAGSREGAFDSSTNIALTRGSGIKRYLLHGRGRRKGTHLTMLPSPAAFTADDTLGGYCAITTVPAQVHESWSKLSSTR